MFSDDRISSSDNYKGRKWINKSAWSSTLLVNSPSSLMRCYYRQLLYPEYPRIRCQVKKWLRKKADNELVGQTISTLHSWRIRVMVPWQRDMAGIHTSHRIPQNCALRQKLPYHPRQQSFSLDFITILQKSQQTETVQWLCSVLEEFCSAPSWDRFCGPTSLPSDGQLALFGYPDWGIFRTFSLVVRQMPGYNSQRGGTAGTFPN